MYRHLKIAGITALFIFVLCSLSFAQGEEKITISTYYPSPAGVYHIMQLFPTTERPDCTEALRGALLYYDVSDSVQMCDCQGTPLHCGWRDVFFWGQDFWWRSDNPDATNPDIYNFNQGGRVAIGKKTNDAKLDVYTTNTNAGNPRGLLNLEVATFGTGANSQNSYFIRAVDIGAGGQPALYLRGDGNLGLGTATPGAKLDVRGSLDVNGITYVLRLGRSNNEYLDIVGVPFLNQGTLFMFQTQQWTGSGYQTKEAFGISPSGYIRIPYGTPQPGKVLAAIDTYGHAEWRQGLVESPPVFPIAVVRFSWTGTKTAPKEVCYAQGMKCLGGSDPGGSSGFVNCCLKRGEAFWNTRKAGALCYGHIGDPNWPDFDCAGTWDDSLD